MALTKKQQLFADKYIETLNATQSAIFAGYSKKTASVIGNENLGKPYIKEYIDKRLGSKQNNLIMSQDEVLEGLTAIARNKKADNKDRIKAYQLMGKRYSIFTDKVVQTNINSPIDALVKSIENLKNED